jgi:hypothetical protein
MAAWREALSPYEIGITLVGCCTRAYSPGTVTVTVLVGVRKGRSKLFASIRRRCLLWVKERTRSRGRVRRRGLRIASSAIII